MDQSRVVLASFAQAQLEAAVDSYRQLPSRTSLHDLKRAVAAYQRCQTIVRGRGQCHVLSPFRAVQR